MCLFPEINTTNTTTTNTFMKDLHVHTSVQKEMRACAKHKTNISYIEIN